MARVKRAHSYARGRGWVSVAVVALVIGIIGAAAAAASSSHKSTHLRTANSLRTLAAVTGQNPDTCGYNPSAAPKPGGGTVVFDENSVTRAIAFYASGGGGRIGAFTNDESGLFIGAGGTATSGPSGTNNPAVANPVTLGSGVDLAGRRVAPVIFITDEGTSPSIGTLKTTIASGTTVTSITLNAALTAAVATNDVLSIGGQSFLVASPGAASGATVIPVASYKTGSAIAAGTPVLDLKSRGGDYEAGGTIASHDSSGNPTATAIYGSWSNTLQTKPLNKNNWILGTGSDAIPAVDAFGTATTSFNEGYGSEVAWNSGGLQAFNPSTNTYVALQAGHTYRVQSITHDTDQNKTSGGGDTGEVCSVFSLPGVSTLSPDPSAGVSLGTDGKATIHDDATVSGVNTPLQSGTNEVVVTAFSDSTCTTKVGSAAHLPLDSSNPNQKYSASFTVSGHGTYYYTASLTLGGVANAVPANTCPTTGESTLVNPLQTKLLTDSRSSAPDGTYSPVTSLSDKATLSGGTSGADGTLTFKLYGPGATCTPLLGTTTVTVNNGANGATYTGTINATDLPPAGPNISFFGAGTYHWSVSYGGDTAGDNLSSSDGVNPCPAVDDSTTGNFENPVINAPKIGITKLVHAQTIEGANNAQLTPPSGTTPGTATWQITVTNTGNTDLTSVGVTDPNASDCVKSFSGTLAKGAGETPYNCSLTGLTAGMTNTATASGTAGAQTVMASDSADVKVINPKIEVIKNTCTDSTCTTLGTDVSVTDGGTAYFQITVTNKTTVSGTANDPAAAADYVLDNVFTTDANASGCAATYNGAGGTKAVAGLQHMAKDAVVTYTCSRVMHDSDFVNGIFTNGVTGCGNDELGGQVCDHSPTPTPNQDCTSAGGFNTTQCVTVHEEKLTSDQDFQPRDTAHLSGLSNTPNGTLTFGLYKDGAGLKTCSQAHLIYTATAPVTANGDYTVTSSLFLSALNQAKFGNTATGGNYNWQITYAGDTNGNAEIDGACGDENFQVNNGH
jgi:hypothetical protein